MNITERTLFLGVFLLVILTSGCTKKADNKINQIINAEKGFQFPLGFPADPGDLGKKTIEGIDSDHDGLRDDVQRWIYARFPNDPRKRAALRQMATYLQSDLLIKRNKKEMDENLIRMKRALACLGYTFPNDHDDNVEMRLVRAKVLNTRARTERYLEVDSWFGGKMLGPSLDRKASTCDD